MFNVGCGERITLNRLVALLEKQFGVKAQVSYGPPKTGDVRHSLADIELARRVLGYSPTINIEEGLRLMMEAMRGRKPC